MPGRDWKGCLCEKGVKCAVVHKSIVKFRLRDRPPKSPCLGLSENRHKKDPIDVYSLV